MRRPTKEQMQCAAEAARRESREQTRYSAARRAAFTRGYKSGFEAGWVASQEERATGKPSADLLREELYAPFNPRKALRL